MKNIKIVHLTSVHPRHDARIFLKMCSSLARKKLNVYLVVADGAGNENKNNVKISNDFELIIELRYVFHTFVYKNKVHINLTLPQISQDFGNLWTPAAWIAELLGTYSRVQDHKNSLIG